MTKNQDETAEFRPRRDLGFFELAFHSDPGLISTIRRFIATFYGRLMADRDGADRIALAVHELLESTVRPSKGGEVTLRVEILERGSQLRVRVRVRNRADERGGQALRALIKEVCHGGDPGEVYRAAMRDGPGKNDGSRVAFARVQAEAGMWLAVEEGEDGVPALVARADVPLDSKS